MKSRLAVMFLMLCIATLPNFAQSDLYDNGPIDGHTDGWAINNGFAVSDSFTLAAASNVTGISFGAWLFPGDVLESAEVSITSGELGGTAYLDEIVNFTQTNCASNGYFNICEETGSLPDVILNAGTYWLNLQNAVVNTGDPVFWDENSGPSSASQSSVGTIPSESFTVFGNGTTSTTHNETTPEPNSGLLLATGLISALGLLSRKVF